MEGIIIQTSGHLFKYVASPINYTESSNVVASRLFGILVVSIGQDLFIDNLQLPRFKDSHNDDRSA